jgi:uncharacterized membrane protein YphA (DoxX/SURF4 family)
MPRPAYLILRICIAAVWLLNGVWAKLLGAVPRHQAIVARFFGAPAALWMTPVIGVAETLMAVWILTGYKRRLNAALQIAIVATMNTLETIFARDLLLWGGWNAVWAALLCVIIALYGWAARTNKNELHAVLS